MYIVSPKTTKNIPFISREFTANFGCLDNYSRNEILRPDIILGPEIIQNGLELIRVGNLTIDRKYSTRFSKRIAVKDWYVELRILWIVSK